MWNFILPGIFKMYEELESLVLPEIKSYYKVGVSTSGRG
jgi:hypothetical protein